MARKYLGGSGESLTIWISVAASTVLVFYGYDQVHTQKFLLIHITNIRLGSIWQCPRRRRLPRYYELSYN